MKPRTSLAALLLAAIFACGAQEPPQALSGQETATLREAGLAPADPGDGAMSADDAARLQAAQAAGERYHARVAAELAATGKPRELAFAATLLQLAGDAPVEPPAPGDDTPSQPASRDPRIAQWRQLASARAGSDVLANVLLMQGDTAADAATRREAAARWARLEPDNLAPVVFAMQRPAGWLPQAGAYARFDTHYYELARWMIAALRDRPLRPDESAALGVDSLPEDAVAVAVVGILAGVAMPVNLLQSKECLRDEELAATPTRRMDCRHVARLLVEASDTSLAESIGLALLRATAVTPAEVLDADLRQRRKDWQMLEWGRLAREQDDMGTAQFASLLRDPAIANEQELIARVLADAGVPPDPAEGWRAPWEQGRQPAAQR
ncbi:MAG TPA: hypothetical protein VM619_12160 [Luteimonas sp.]|nr:hypothetical protein [Luteimonas sp.]